MPTLAVWADLKVPDILRSVPGVLVRAGAREAVDDVLYDASDLRLLRSGVQVRGGDDAWHVWVAPSPWWHADVGDDVVLHAEPIVDGRPPDAVAGVLRGAPLSAAVTVRDRRRSWDVVLRPPPSPAPEPDVVPERSDVADDPDSVAEAAVAVAVPVSVSAPVAAPEPRRATVVLEDLALLTGRRVSARRTLVHIDGDAGLVGQLVARFESAGAEHLGDTVPLLDLLGGRVRRPVVPGDPDARLPHDATAGDVVTLTITRAVARLLANDLAIRLDLGPEGVHQARVATRRLRSDLRTFAGLVDEQWADAIAVELRWLADVLGDVRDADVLGSRLIDRVGGLDDEDQANAMWLIDEIVAERERAGEALEAAMLSDRYRSLLEALVDAANHPPLTPEADADAAATFDDLARRSWQPLRKAARRVVRADDPDDVAIDDIHRVRIRAKRFRYAADAAAPVEPAAAKHAAVLAALQDELGDLNDAANAEAWLRERLPAASAVQAFAIGQLVAAERAEIDRRRRTWLRTWRAVDRTKRRRWLRA